MTSETLSDETRPLALTFHGTAWEYFRVWLPGACLTWLTLGLFAGWAAVRRNRYLLARTRLDGLPFAYQARVWPLLFGRACLLFSLGLAWLAFLLPEVGCWVLAGYAYLLPSILVRVARFAARCRTYCGEPGEFTGSARPFYRAVAPLLASVALTAGLVVGQIHHYLRPFSDVHPILVTLPYYALLLWALVSMETTVRNVVAKHTRWGSLSFDSRLETGAMVWLHLTNGLASVLSFGLLIPWAEIRARRYRLSRIVVLEAEA